MAYRKCLVVLNQSVRLPVEASMLSISGNVELNVRGLVPCLGVCVTPRGAQ